MSEKPDDLRTWFIAQLDQRVRSGQPPASAVREVMELVTELHLEQQAWEIAATPYLTNLWTIQNHYLRRIDRPTRQGTRRVELSGVTTTLGILDSLFEVSPGSWCPLRDMDITWCEKVAVIYDKRANAMANKARILRALSARLEGIQTVGERWSEEEVIQLVKFYELGQQDIVENEPDLALVQS